MTSLQDQVYQLITDLDASKEAIVDEIGADFLALVASTVARMAAAGVSDGQESLLVAMFVLGYIHAS
jgi:hypothetical protein